MIHDNDKTIFEYLGEVDNNILSEYNDDDIKEILYYLNRYYLEYRNSIGLSSMDTFGIEIEIENLFSINPLDLSKFQLDLYDFIGDNKWDCKNDRSLYRGREITSSILVDNIMTWDMIKKVCNFASDRGNIGSNCGAHVHVGSQVLGENALYWYRFFKLWCVYEKVIYRFCYGEYLRHRPNILKYARPAISFYEERLALLNKDLDYSVIEMLNIIEPNNMGDKYTKNFGISYWRMLADDNYNQYEDFNMINDGCTIEYRCPNGTLDPVIWQNNINFFVKLMKYCKSNKYDDDIINKRKGIIFGINLDIREYSLIYLDEAIELCDMIFDNNIDKIYFLRQYLKSYEINNKEYVKTKKFTV